MGSLLTKSDLGSHFLKVLQSFSTARSIGIIFLIDLAIGQPLLHATIGALGEALVIAQKNMAPIGENDFGDFCCFLNLLLYVQCFLGFILFQSCGLMIPDRF